jgi:predicted secreted protein
MKTAYPDVMPEPEEIARHFRLQHMEMTALKMAFNEVSNSISEHISQKQLVKDLEHKIAQYDLALKNVQRALLKEKKSVRCRIWENIWSEDGKLKP